MNQFQCEICGEKDALIFECNYCGGHFCAEHHLPESHNCKSKPKIAPFHMRPTEVKLNEPNEPSVMSYPNATQHSKTKPWKKIAGIFVILIIVGLILWIAYPFIQQAAKNPSIPNQTPNTSSITPAPITTPALTTSYVEVDYQTVGWFYGTVGNLLDSNYNYTYLVLNVTITNHGYSQVNVVGSNGFSVLINGNNYTSLISTPSSLYNGSISSFYGMQSSYSFDSELPSQAILLDTGSVTGTITFQFGDPNVYPQQPQILNEPFVLYYLVSYGNSVPLWERQVYQLGPYATVVIN
ncbi:MAG: AN1-type zinc finger domain-containing protein [Candidatus Bathyarchaeia archaeon]|jgi:uncharacterized protein with PQ loop repeat